MLLFLALLFIELTIGKNLAQLFYSKLKKLIYGFLLYFFNTQFNCQFASKKNWKISINIKLKLLR